MRRILDTYWYCGSIRAAEAPTLRLLGRMVDLGVYAIYGTDRTAAQPSAFASNNEKAAQQMQAACELPTSAQKRITAYRPTCNRTGQRNLRYPLISKFINEINKLSYVKHCLTH